MTKKKAALLGSAAATPAADRKPIRIATRLATPLDVPALWHLLIRYFDDLKLFYPPPDMNPTIAWGLTMIMKNLVVVAEDLDTGALVGSIGMDVGTFPWNPEFHYLNGEWFYVAPERRGGGTADKLMKVAKDIAAKNGLPLRLDSIWGVAPELQDRYRKNHGFQYVGGNHVWFPPAPDRGNDGQQHQGRTDHQQHAAERSNP